MQKNQCFITICLVVLLLVPAEALALPARHMFRVHYAGAEAEGKTPVTANLQKVLDDAAAAGGGTVYLEPGTYLTGALFLKSHTHLVLAKGATILGITRQDAYPLVATRAAGIEMQWPAALVNIAGQTDVSIQGAGTIDGHGNSWWQKFWSLVPAYQSRGLRWAVDYDVQRPELIRIYKSSSVRIVGGLMLRRSAFWTVHICYSSHVTVNGLTIRDNGPDGALGPSTDGVDIDSSRHVLVEHVDIANNDDAICLKAGMNADGLRVNRPTEDVVVRDSIVRKAISAIAIGSDTAGGFRNIDIHGITVLGGVRYGIYLKSTHTRGGWTDGVKISNVKMDGVKTAVMIDLNYFPAFSTPIIPPGIENNLPPGLHAVPSYWHILAEPVQPQLGIPHFHDVTLADIRATNAGTAFRVNAIPGALLDRFTLKNIDIQAHHAGSVQYISSWKLEDVKIHASDGVPLKIEHATDVSGTFQQIP